MACARRMKTLASTCVILSGMTNIACLLYVGWITNFVNEKDPERKLEEDKGETLRIIERLERLENVVNSHLQESSKMS
ncbi:polypeptide N-acetylgalactosaminyltransferase 18-like [Ictalurus furcatus]|uniref:polypeptide N-acetylgalactosaminyltransferase 18-like n=1 Tax=Ictalurus furcatus TaxID=66913 RepID=UPI0023508894|nr:polypeptide N-acetylgalactosaminyltransferase 18-like [Ictalurus furcatus]